MRDMQLEMICKDGIVVTKIETKFDRDLHTGLGLDLEAECLTCQSRLNTVTVTSQD